MIKTTEEILNEHKDVVFLWKDKETLDVIIEDASKKFIESLINYKCLKCDNDVIAGNERLCTNFNDDVRGIEITCRTCNQKWFIHEKFSPF